MVHERNPFSLGEWYRLVRPYQSALCDSDRGNSSRKSDMTSEATAAGMSDTLPVA